MSTAHLSEKQEQRIRDEGCGVPLSASDIDAKELGQLQGLIQMISCGWMNRVSEKPHQVRAIVTASEIKPNAWAWDSFGGRNSHAVVFRESLLDGLGELAGQVNRLVERTISSNLGDDHFRPLWGDVPNDLQHRTAFSELILHVAVAFLTLHEVAHIALGHCFHYISSKGVPAAINEHSNLQSDWSASDLRSQALELDADIHAIEWLREYLELNRERMTRDAVSECTATCAIWNQFVASPGGIRFLVVAGAWLALLCVGAKKFHPSQLTAGSHPSGAMRIAILVHLESKLSARRSKSKPSLQIAAADFALCLYALVSLTDETLKALEIGVPAENILPIRNPLETAKRNCGLAGVLAKWSDVGDAVKNLAQERADIEADLVKNRYSTSEYLVSWFEI